MALRVLIVRPNKHAVLACWRSEWANARHDVYNNFSRVEHGANALVLRSQLRIPVYFAVVKVEDAACLADFNYEVVRTSEDLVVESTELALCTNVVDLVDDSANGRVFVYDDLSDDMFVRVILSSDI